MLKNRMGMLQRDPHPRSCRQVVVSAPSFLRQIFATRSQQPGPAAITDRMLTEPPRQDPRLFELVAVKALRPFCIAGRRIEIGETVHIERHLVESLEAIGKAKRV